jgi:septal ring factor EnvC (AmiA/AmiB activator)
MKRIQVLMLITAFFVAGWSSAQNQETQQLSLDEGTIESQFEYITSKSTRYRSEKGIPYKVVRQAWLTKLRSNVSDSLTKAYAASKALQATIDGQKNEISSLQTQLKTTTDNLTTITEEKDSISFFGSLWSKAAYKALMWGIVAVLSVLLAFFVFKFRNSNVITQEARNNLAELEAEYEDHRRRALEREQKVRRQLQDEINKQKTGKKN